MSQPIEDYGLIGDFEMAALVGRDGSIDQLSFPRFDSGACFAALLGGLERGRWLLRPQAEVREVSRRYRESTLILETEFRVPGAHTKNYLERRTTIRIFLGRPDHSFVLAEDRPVVVL